MPHDDRFQQTANLPAGESAIAAIDPDPQACLEAIKAAIRHNPARGPQVLAFLLEQDDWDALRAGH